ncbi:ChrR family anti-sigma-E factor [Shewanella sp. JM162201]|uniref:ChrR family anti-sigma-E factor n=1 Tax=Shewanella jiangmenensis TaxID=2837387 RepID=A0ABS5V9X8_9GAMM|nr:ChrR family anti-sigma-E factor [Shewanella jiangmenensis]MBT1445843.1 ChrR family anti-sigma-E factor [Shewanella jiangmenensis]
MINHHPSDEMLLAHAAGETSFAMALALSAHCELCHQCAERVSLLQQKLARHHLSAPSGVNALDDATRVETRTEAQQSDWLNMDSLFDAITATEAEEPVLTKGDLGPAVTAVKGEQFILPRTFRQLIHSDLASSWKGLGNVSRLRFDTQDGKARASLLHIAAGGEIPEHTHKGVEITLLLDGHFSDEFGSYGPGDFMLMDGSKQHTPITQDGCLCFTVVDAPLHFTRGLSKLLNPIGELIY